MPQTEVMPRTAPLALTFVFALATILVACGGGSGGKPTAASPGALATSGNDCIAIVESTPGATLPHPTSGPPPAVTGKPTATASGLQIVDIKVGTGAAAVAGDCVSARYTTWLQNGTLIDSSALHGGPIRFSLNKVLKSWREGIPGMKVGGKRRLIVPPSLGYGAAGNGSIPPNAKLVFDIELVSIP